LPKEVGVGAWGLGLNPNSRATLSDCAQNRLLVMTLKKEQHIAEIMGNIQKLLAKTTS
jgi:hypothetical protein